MGNRQRHSTRMTLAGLVAVAGLGLAGCGGEESGTDVEDVTEGEVAESSPAAEPTEAMTGAVPPVGYEGMYNRDYYDQQQTYQGQSVSLTGEVEAVVSPEAFSISDPNDAELDSLLVVHNLDQPPALEEGQMVQVEGTVQTDFDPATVGGQMGADLDENVFGDFEGDPWIEATGVSTDAPAEDTTEG